MEKKTYIAPITKVDVVGAVSIIATSIIISNNGANPSYEGGCDSREAAEWDFWDNSEN